MSTVVTPNKTIQQPTSVSRQHGCLFYVTRASKFVALALVALTMSGVVFQLVATERDRRTFLPPGQLVDIGGYKLHIHCTGKGSPTVILDAGRVAFSSHWGWVQPEIAKTTRVCAYDRAGYGWSDPGPEPRTGLQMTRELHALLQSADIDGPYVLVGHSMGGIYAMFYATGYPDEVAGIVLVDSPLDLPYEPGREPPGMRTLNNLFSALYSGMARIGLTRLIFSSEKTGLPPPQNAEVIAFRSTVLNADNQWADVRSDPETRAQSRTMRSLGNKPLITVSAGNDDGMTEAEWQARVVAHLTRVSRYFSSNNTIVIVQGANHASILWNEQYAAQVSQAIIRVIEAVRTGKSFAK
jgi:pimeloyl-ACP methyl ester carboxylesterase